MRGNGRRVERDPASELEVIVLVGSARVLVTPVELGPEPRQEVREELVLVPGRDEVATPEVDRFPSGVAGVHRVRPVCRGEHDDRVVVVPGVLLDRGEQV